MAYVNGNLALQPGRDPLPIAGALREPAKQSLEADHLRPEDRAVGGQLALGVHDVAEGGNHEDRVFRQPRAQTAEDLPGLGRVRGPGDELERHG